MGPLLFVYNSTAVHLSAFHKTTFPSSFHDFSSAKKDAQPKKKKKPKPLRHSTSQEKTGYIYCVKEKNHIAQYRGSSKFYYSQASSNSYCGAVANTMSTQADKKAEVFRERDTVQ